MANLNLRDLPFLVRWTCRIRGLPNTGELNGIPKPEYREVAD